MTELSAELNRQIGVIIDRRGVIIATILGDEREIVIPVLSDYPLGRKALRGLRCVHTHLKGEALSTDDLTDLAILRLDCMAAITITEDKLPDKIFFSHLLPLKDTRDGEPYKIEPGTPFQSFSLKLDEFISTLETEIGRAIVRRTDDKRERAILISVALTTPSTYKKIRERQENSLKELQSLAESSDVLVLDSMSQRPKKFNPRYLMGSGKIKEMIITALQKEASIIIFDQELTPTQIRELGLITELKVIDRTQLILDIFAKRANSKDGRVQVELAQLKYLLPRLMGKGISMSRLMGGIGGRGPGETKLEVDRRRIGDRIARLEKELKNLSKGRRERRRKRASSGIPIISIVGYTNAGKSTLLNALTKSKTIAEDKLFATLDTATRRIRFPKERDAVITDTVGFIKDLPKELKRAFRATFEEMEDADLLAHVVDISDENFLSHIETVEELLEEIGLLDIPRILIFNKCELIDKEILKNLEKRYEALAISALEPKTLIPLVELLERKLYPNRQLDGSLRSNQTDLS
jgi:GTP-binding protein HflX